MNLNPSDGHKFGWGSVGGEGWPVYGADVGTAATQFAADYASSAAWKQPANYIAIVRHNGGQCDAVEVWRFKDPGVSMLDYFKADTTYQRAEVTDGGAVFTQTKVDAPNDAILGNNGPLVFNWWHANNGCRIAHASGLSY